jgi:catechol 2,3-dioxygenase-like lactoylglutathione lyase family enzyme
MAVSVRYIVSDVEVAVAFYRDLLGFQVDMQRAPGFAALSLGELKLFLNKPGAGGAGQAMPDARLPEPGGWNRFQLEVENLREVVDRLRSSGGQFRNEIVEGIGGNQILLEDPSGNPIELFQRAAR